jgi:uncharacterized protein (TIGR02265 family)
VLEQGTLFASSASQAPIELLVFDQTLEALFVRGLRGRITQPMQARLQSAGVDLTKRLLPAYAFHTWMESLRIAAEELYPGETLEQGQFLLGQTFIEGYGQTLMGKAILRMIRILGPRRTLLRATHNFRSGNNYTETTLTEISANEVRLWMNEVGPYPMFTAGIIYAALRASGVNADVTFEGHDGHACAFLCVWK